MLGFENTLFRRYLKFFGFVSLLFTLSGFAFSSPVYCFKSITQIAQNQPPVAKWSGYSNNLRDGPKIIGYLTVYCLAPQNPTVYPLANAGCGCQIKMVSIQGDIVYNKQNYKVTEITNYAPCAGGTGLNTQCFNAYVP